VGTGIDRYRAALEHFSDPAAVGQPVPVSGWCARDVVEHMIAAQRALLVLFAPEDTTSEATAATPTDMSLVDAWNDVRESRLPP
jgi:hypothetical protein